MELDMSILCKDIHLTGFECMPIKALRQLQRSRVTPADLREVKVVFWQHSNTNPDKVTCSHCHFGRGEWVHPEFHKPPHPYYAQRRTTH